MTLDKTLHFGRALRLFAICAPLFIMSFGFGSAAAQCKVGDPIGMYTGSATSVQSGALDLTLNLLCDKSSYTGFLKTPVGVYTVVSGSFQAGTLRSDIVSAGNHIAVELKRNDDDLEGTFRSADDSGPVKLHRIGDAAAPAPHAK